MTLDAFLYRSDDFRKSTFENPWPLPLQQDEPNHNFRLFGPLFKGLVPKLRQLLAEHSIKQNQSWADTYMASKPGFPGGDKPLLTLMILVDQGFNNSRTWGDAKDTVHQIFAEDSFPNVEVELYDTKRSLVPKMFPLQPRIEAIIRHQSKRDQLIKCLHEDLPGMWSAMCVARRLWSLLGHFRSRTGTSSAKSSAESLPVKSGRRILFLALLGGVR